MEQIILIDEGKRVAKEVSGVSRRSETGTEQQLSGTLERSGPFEQGPMKSPSSRLPGAVMCGRAKTKGTEITGHSSRQLTHQRLHKSSPRAGMRSCIGLSY